MNYSFWYMRVMDGCENRQEAVYLIEAEPRFDQIDHPGTQFDLGYFRFMFSDLGMAPLPVALEKQGWYQLDRFGVQSIR